jgi:hypothetical protein
VKPQPINAARIVGGALIACSTRAAGLLSFWTITAR